MAGSTIGIGSGSEAADLTVTREGSDILVADALGQVYPMSGCSKAKAKTVKCPAAQATRIVAVLGDGADTLDASAATVAFSVWGGSGDDTLRMRNGLTEYVSCGSGADSGSVDGDDTLASDCEPTLERPIGATPALAPAPAPEPADAPVGDPPAGTGATDDPGGQDDADDVDAPGGPLAPTGTAPVAISTPATVRLTPDGGLPVGVSCTADAGKCTGAIEIVELNGALKARPLVESARRRNTTKKKKKATVLGRGKFSVAAGKSKRVTVQLSRRGRRRIIRKKKRKTRAKIVVSMRAPDGTVTTTEKKVSIAAPRERRTSARRGSRKPTSKGRGRR